VTRSGCPECVQLADLWFVGRGERICALIRARRAGTCPPCVRIVYTALYATAVRIVYASRRGARDAEHIGPTRDEAEMEVLKAAARQGLAAGQDELGVGLERRRRAC
jgi:hypothetical protein